MNELSSLPPQGWEPPEVAAMRAALEAAGLGERGANPLVGAAVLDGDRIVALGHHRGAGTPHAEVDALARARSAGADLTRATVLVTLEPCHHHGRTGPCTRALIEAGVPRVIYAVADPDPQAGGGGAALRAAGIEVRCGLLAAEATRLNHRWLRAAAEGRPFITAKTAQSLDARIAAADSSSQWITGPASREHAHLLRSRCDAILVGTATLAADNPRLSARDAEGKDLPDQPLRVVMGATPVPPGAAVRQGRWHHCATRDPRQAVAELAALGVRHLLIEGGATITTAFLAHDLVDALLIYQAPLLLGAGRPAVGNLGVGTLARARRFELDRPPARLGPDTLLQLSPLPPDDGAPARSQPPP